MGQITTVEAANRFLREEYMGEFNRRFQVAAAVRGSAFVRARRKDLDLVFPIQQERRVNGDNTVVLDNRVLQIDKTRWRDTLAGCTVQVLELLDGQIVIRYGPHEVAHLAPQQVAAARGRGKPKASARHFDGEGAPDEYLQRMQRERLTNWRRLQEFAGLR